MDDLPLYLIVIVPLAPLCSQTCENGQMEWSKLHDKVGESTYWCRHNEARHEVLYGVEHRCQYGRHLDIWGD